MHINPDLSGSKTMDTDVTLSSLGPDMTMALGGNAGHPDWQGGPGTPTWPQVVIQTMDI